MMATCGGGAGESAIRRWRLTRGTNERQSCGLASCGRLQDAIPTINQRFTDCVTPKPTRLCRKAQNAAIAFAVLRIANSRLRCCRYWFGTASSAPPRRHLSYIHVGCPAASAVVTFAVTSISRRQKHAACERLFPPAIDGP